MNQEKDRVIVKQEGAVAWIVLNRPECLNALNMELLSELDRVVQSMAKDPSLSVMILTGAGRAFSVGMDLQMMGRGEKGSIPSMAISDAFSRWISIPIPKIAAVNGPAITGGLELVLACDLAIASERAVFADTHALVGVLPGGGMSQILPRLIGERRAKEMSLTGRFVSAREAFEWGLVNRVVPHEELEDSARGMARALMECDRPALLRIKGLIEEGMNVGMQEALALEKRAFLQWMSSVHPQSIQERVEGILRRGRAQMK